MPMRQNTENEERFKDTNKTIQTCEYWECLHQNRKSGMVHKQRTWRHIGI